MASAVVAVVSAVASGAAGAAAAGAVGGGLLGVAAGAIAGAVVGGLTSAVGAIVTGRDPGDAFKKGLITGGLAGGLAGVGAALSGGKEGAEIASKSTIKASTSKMAGEGAKTAMQTGTPELTTSVNTLPQTQSAQSAVIQQTPQATAVKPPAEGSGVLKKAVTSPGVAEQATQESLLAKTGGLLKSGIGKVGDMWDKMGDFGKVMTIQMAGSTLSGMGEAKAAEEQRQQQLEDEARRRGYINNVDTRFIADVSNLQSSIGNAVTSYKSKYTG